MKVCILLVLLAAASLQLCCKNLPKGSDRGTVAAPPVESALVDRHRSDGVRPELAWSDIQMMDPRPGLVVRDTVREEWYNAAFLPPVTGLRLAIEGYFQIHGTLPATLRDAHDLIFTWPTDFQAGHPLLAETTKEAMSTLESRGPFDKGKAYLYAEIADQKLRVRMPTAVANEPTRYTVQEHSLPTVDAGTEQLLSSTVDWEKEPVGILSWGRAFPYLIKGRQPQNVRLGTFINAVVLLMESAVQNTGTLPSSISEMEANAKGRIINMSPTASQDPDITISFDGVQAYLIKAKVGRDRHIETVVFYKQAGRKNSLYLIRSAKQFKESFSDRSMTELGRWNFHE